MSENKPNPVGRPTDYLPEYCDRVIEYGKEGKSLTWMASRLGVHKDTVYEWAKVYPDFSDALNIARTHCQAWWEDAGQEGMGSQGGINAGIWNKNMSCRFRPDWTDKTESVVAATVTEIKRTIVDPGNPDS